MTEHSREWLLLNAVESWLHHYGNVGTPTVAEYKQLRDEFFDAYAATISKDAEEPTPPALDREVARELWDKSIELSKLNS